MAFRLEQLVRIKERDTLRGGETAVVKQILPPTCGSNDTREYLLEFKGYPKRVPIRDDRFLLCIYREEQLVSQEDKLS